MNQPCLDVIVADDHEAVREGLTHILARDPRIRLAAVVENFQQLMHVLPQQRVDVLVLDLGNMGMSPLMMVERIRRLYPQLAIVVYSSSLDVVPEMLRAGVKGYVAKEEVSEQLLVALHTVSRGQTFLSPGAQAYMERSHARTARNRLTPQELNVLKLLVQGYSTDQIADHLSIDRRTAYHHIGHIRSKTGCSRTQLVTWYHQVYGSSAHDGIIRPDRTSWLSVL
jgi:DNA-binding NarL/FixJ family response regulator